MKMTVQQIDEKACHWLAEANAASEKGQHEKAEKLFAKAQYWLDRLNKALGNS